MPKAKPKSALKFDSGKPDLALVPRASVEAIARAMMFGAEKYGRDNWRLGFDDNTRVLAAALRHIFAYVDGERTDPESGLSHLDHALAGLSFAAHYEKKGKL